MGSSGEGYTQRAIPLQHSSLVPEILRAYVAETIAGWCSAHQ